MVELPQGFQKQAPVYIKNKARETGVKREAEARTPEYVRLGVKPAELKSFEDDFRSAAATKKKLLIERAEPEEFVPPPVVNQPVVGQIELSVMQGRDPNSIDLDADDVPEPPVRRRRFLVVDGVAGSQSDDDFQEPVSPVAMPQQSNIIVEENFNLDIGDYGIFMGNNFICACKDQEEAEQAVEIILSTDPPEEIVVVKRVSVKIGVSIKE